MRLRQDGFHVDLQRPLALAGDGDANHALPLVLRQLLRRPEAQQPRCPFGDRGPGLANDRRLGAGTTQPPPDGAVRPDHGGRPAREPTPGSVYSSFLHRQRPALRAARFRRGSAAASASLRCCDPPDPPFAAWMASHTLAEVTGMSRLRTPRCPRASITAFTKAAGDPTVADSPTPFAPRGWWGDGVTVSPSSNRGVSHAVGSR